MFLDQIRKYNPDLLTVALEFHQSGEIPPSCFIIDLDMVVKNTHILVGSAQKNNLSQYFITKQVGFNPIFAREVSKNGISKAVSVDWNEALSLLRNKIPLGHVGHLVQIPNCFFEKILQSNPEVVTVFSFEKAHQLSEIAKKNHLWVISIACVDEDDLSFGSDRRFSTNSPIENLEKILHCPISISQGSPLFPSPFSTIPEKLCSHKNLHTLRKPQKL
jgi:predicted amino acid racemase